VEVDARGDPFSWTVTRTLAAADVCQAADSAGPGKKTCCVTGVTYSSASIFGVAMSCDAWYIYQ